MAFVMAMATIGGIVAHTAVKKKQRQHSATFNNIIRDPTIKPYEIPVLSQLDYMVEDELLKHPKGLSQVDKQVLAKRGVAYVNSVLETHPDVRPTGRPIGMDWLHMWLGTTPKPKPLSITQLELPPALPRQKPIPFHVKLMD